MKKLNKILVYISLLSAFVYANQPFYFIIRVDDIQSRINWEPRRIIDFESAVEARSAKISWAVIPHRLNESQNSDGQLSADLKNSISKGHEVVVHGYNHICPLCDQSSHEMYCTYYNTPHSYETQLGMVENSLQIFKDELDYIPASFVPPGHHADTTTYKVLLDKKFKWLSTTASTKENIYKNLYNLSPHNEYTWYLTTENYKTNLQNTLADVENISQRDGYYCLLLHDPFIRKGYEDGLVIKWTGELLDSLISRYGEQIRFKTLTETAQIFSAVTSIAYQAELPDNIRLNQNYPNPFNPSTTIEYSVGANYNSPFKVDLAIYNLLGQKVTTLVSEKQFPGNYKVIFNGSDLSSGIYFYRLEMGDKEIQKRMILIK